MHKWIRLLLVCPHGPADAPKAANHFCAGGNRSCCCTIIFDDMYAGNCIVTEDEVQTRYTELFSGMVWAVA